MRFSYDVTIPTSTPATAPHTAALRSDNGRVTQLIIRFRAGCHNRVFVAIFDGLVQIAPAHETPALYGDNHMISIPMTHDLLSKPYELTFKGWSPSTRYPHTISVWIDLLENDPIKKQGAISNILHLLGGSD